MYNNLVRELFVKYIGLAFVLHIGLHENHAKIPCNKVSAIKYVKYKTIEQKFRNNIILYRNMQ